MFSDSQKIEIQNKGIQLERVEKQIERFKTGFAALNIIAPATYAKGILKIEESDDKKKLTVFFFKYKNTKC